MAGSVNKVLLVGNLGRDPEIRTMQSGSKIANLSVATSETWNDKQTGERKEKTEWHRVVVFNEHIVGYLEQYCKKGAKLYIEGTLETRKWTDQSGQDKYTTEIVLRPFKGEITGLSSANGGDQQEESGGGRSNYRAGPTTQERRQATPSGSKPQWEPPNGGDLDDAIPF